MKNILVSTSCVMGEGFMNTLFTYYPQPPMKYSNNQLNQQMERHKIIVT